MDSLIPEVEKGVEGVRVNKEDEADEADKAGPGS